MFILYFIKNLVVNNPYKLLMILSLFVLWRIGPRIDKVENTYRFIQSFEYGSKWLFITEGGRAAGGYGSSGFNVVSFDECPEVISREPSGAGIFKVVEHDILTFLVIILFVVIAIILIVFSVINDDYSGWELDDIIEKSKSDSIIRQISCELEDGIFYYIYKGRLLIRSNTQLNDYNLVDCAKRFSLSTLPKFATKQERRDKKLKELFNES